MKGRFILIGILSLAVLTACALFAPEPQPQEEDDTKSSSSFEFEETPNDLEALPCTVPLEQIVVEAYIGKDGQSIQDDNGIFIDHDVANIKIFDKEFPPLPNQNPSFTCSARVTINEFTLQKSEPYSLYYQGEDFVLEKGEDYRLSIDIDDDGTTEITGRVTLSNIGIQGITTDPIDEDTVNVTVDWEDIGDPGNTTYSLSLRPNIPGALWELLIIEKASRGTFKAGRASRYFLMMSTKTKVPLSIPNGTFEAEWASTYPWIEFPPLNYYPDTDIPPP